MKKYVIAPRFSAIYRNSEAISNTAFVQDSMTLLWYRMSEENLTAIIMTAFDIEEERLNELRGLAYQSKDDAGWIDFEPWQEHFHGIISYNPFVARQWVDEFKRLMKESGRISFAQHSADTNVLIPSLKAALSPISPFAAPNTVARYRRVADSAWATFPDLCLRIIQ